MTEQERQEWWQRVEKMAADAPAAPYSHSKVVDLMRAHQKIIVNLETQLKAALHGPFEVFVKCEKCEHITKAVFTESK